VLQPELFARPSGLPDGMRYETDVLGVTEEADLLAAIDGLPLVEASYRTFTAKRRIASFGFGYDFTENTLLPAPPMPGFLLALREHLAAWSGIPAAALVQATVAEYRPGTQLGWHRDVPHFGMVVGTSLGGPARMRLRPWPHERSSGVRALPLDLAPRSAYVLRDAARWAWQHAISPTKGLRHSITFRTRR
jgi:alkylated DNA repair dioxygenase AlkB